ncbi:MAG: histidine phosphotransferase family protein [Rhodospirillaceae bacterium]|nr:histidine phosphotransferase family protein [Rhodospirillaceae bacterium]
MFNEVQLAQLLCTRLCHDLAGPVGAISAGLELIGADSDLIDGETLSLLSGSAEAAGHKLKFLRVAFGWSGGRAINFAQLESILEDYLIATSAISGVPTLDWPQQDSLALLSHKLSDNGVQVLSNIALLGLECMPSCQSLSITVESNSNGLEVIAHNRTLEGRTSKLREDTAAAIASPDEVEMNAQNIQIHLTRRLVSLSGGKITINGDTEGAIITVNWP